MAEISHQDLCTMYQSSVVLYKDRPVKVKKVGAKREFNLLNLRTQRQAIVPFVQKDFSAPCRRLGFVNYGMSVCYLTRKPKRQFCIGISSENTLVEALSDEFYPDGKANTRAKVMSFDIPELADTLFNEYPTLADAIKQVKAFEGACAFDKQFAVSYDFEIYYRTLYVGDIAKNCTSVDKIQWKPGFEHLAILLGNNHEKAIAPI